ncbi:cytidyltransferase-related domain protein [Ignisphaera aggregans DSM 17230]|uniref:Cytidyltransferase-related domain protein n=1 Tax=Ignisphaera aggregans (strain DSM 17230 / JCM 13409 / AQ1.S1) TaxID=583356 RepID=E0SPF7_IGNAA|nr:cytidyltransferase-related domain protein [Ignisphaera aggregans DSM 17230]
MIAMSGDICERLYKYLSMFSESIKTLRIVDSSCSNIVDLAMLYYKDSRYYYEKGDCVTGLVTISYAEGLLDALRNLGLIEWSWVKPRERIVFAAGSFDILHPGHIEFLRWASTLGDKLYVVVSRDDNYERFKGVKPVFREDERLAIVSAIRFVYKALLGSRDDIYSSIHEVKPSVIALGYDQLRDRDLKEVLSREGLDVEIYRMDRRVENYSSTNIKNRICSYWCLKT